MALADHGGYAFGALRALRAVDDKVVFNPHNVVCEFCNLPYVLTLTFNVTNVCILFDALRCENTAIKYEKAMM